MHDIVTGKTSVEDARRTYAEVLSAYTLGRSAPYAERLQFDPPQGGTDDPDKPNIAGPLAHQAVEKVKDVLSGWGTSWSRRPGVLRNDLMPTLSP